LCRISKTSRLEIDIKFSRANALLYYFATPAIGETATSGTEEDSYATLMKQIDAMTKSGSISEQYKVAIMAAIKAQELTTEQAVKQLEYEKKKPRKPA